MPRRKKQKIEEKIRFSVKIQEKQVEFDVLKESWDSFLEEVYKNFQIKISGFAIILPEKNIFIYDEEKWNSFDYTSNERLNIVFLICSQKVESKQIIKSVFSFGDNEYGQLCLGDSINRNMPEQIKLLKGKQIIQVSTGYEHILFLSSKTVFII